MGIFNRFGFMYFRCARAARASLRSPESKCFAFRNGDGLNFSLVCVFKAQISLVFCRPTGLTKFAEFASDNSKSLMVYQGKNARAHFVITVVMHACVLAFFSGKSEINA